LTDVLTKSAFDKVSSIKKLCTKCIWQTPNLTIAGSTIFGNLKGSLDNKAYFVLSRYQQKTSLQRDFNFYHQID
jgi:hypothetical protein